MPADDALRSTFAQTGRVWLRGALNEVALAPFDALARDHAGKPGARLADHPALSADAPLGARIAALWPGARARRALFFDKTDARNWGVPWHQDRIIAVRERHGLPGFRNWSQKQGQWHCEPPLPLLNSMLFLRLHLDACGAENGAMEIAAGSHIHGPIAEAQAADIAATHPQELCQAERGDILVLHMLTLHASRPATNPATRRTLRIDYAMADLPAPLEWAW